MSVGEIIYFIILLGGIIMGISSFHKLLVPSRWLFILLVYVFLKETAAFILAGYSKNNLTFYKYLSPLDFSLVAMALMSIPLMQKFRKHLAILTLAVICFYVVNITLLQPPGTGADTNFKMTRSFVIVLFVLLLMTRLYQYPANVSIYRNSSFWLCAGMLMFYSFDIFYWGVFNWLLTKQLAIQTPLRILFMVANYILYSFIGVSVWLNNFDKLPKQYSYARG